MRRLQIITLFITLSLTLHAQPPWLSVGNADVITTNEWLYSPYILDNGEDHVFYFSGTNYVSLQHPLLGEVYNDYANIYFIKYDKQGKAVLSNHIRGTNYISGAFTFDGGLTFLSWANNDVMSEDQSVLLGAADNLEFLASYDREGVLQKMVGIWNLQSAQFVSSFGVQDPNDGSIYVYGNSNQPLDVAGHGIIGSQWLNNFVYILKYDRDLGFLWAFTTGFTPGMNETGEFKNGHVYPLNKGEIFVSGLFNAMGPGPVIGDETLPQVDNGDGLFAFKLDRNGNKIWTQHGLTKGFGYRNYIHKVIPMDNGDIVAAGVTSTGYFLLGDAEFEFNMGNGNLNQFVYRMGPDGNTQWRLPFATMAFDQSEGKGESGFSAKKGTDSERINSVFEYDAFDWNKKILYLSSEFLNDALDVAGRILPKKHAEGVMIASIDLEKGEANWGYSISSRYLQMNGFDGDKYGNVSFMGYSSADQEFDGLGTQGMADKEITFLLGLDFNGNPLWFNNAYPQEGMYGVYGSDLEVLPNGEILAAMSTGSAVTMNIADTTLFRDYVTSLWLLEIESRTEVNGMVKNIDGLGVFPGKVFAYKSAVSGEYPVADSVMLGDDGGYKFTGLYPGSYHFQAVADRESRPNALPTYLGNEVSWEDAEILEVKTASLFANQDIELVEIPPLSSEFGSGEMSGNVSYEDEVVLKSTQGRPVKRATVILVKKATSKSTNSGDVVAYVETDDLGNYIFENVPDGEYLLIVDIPGLPMIQTYDVTIVGNKIVDGLDFTVGEDGINTSGTVDVKSFKPDQFLMFPNPGNGKFFVKLPDPGSYTVEVFSSEGKLIRSMDASAGAGMIRMDISDKNRGIYLVRVNGNGITSTMKYMLK